MAIKYDDPIVLASIDNAEQQYGVPSGLLKSVVVNGERSNSDQVSSAGARTPFQVIPATRDSVLKKYGVDAYSEDPEDQAKVGAILLREGLDRNGNDPVAAVAEYHGGLNLRNHGPLTKAYTDRVIGGWEGNQVADEQPTDDRFSALAAQYGAKQIGGDNSPQSQNIDQPQQESTDDRFSALAAQYGAKPVSDMSSPVTNQPQTQPQKAPEQKPEPTFVDNAITTAKNIPSSAGKFVGDSLQSLYQVVRHPVDNFNKADNYLFNGHFLDNPFTHAVTTKEEFDKRYGPTPFEKDVGKFVNYVSNDPEEAINNLGRHLRDDPVGTAAVIAQLAAPLKGVTMAGRTGAALRAIGEAAETTNALTNNLVTKPFEIVGKGALVGADTALKTAFVRGEKAQGRAYINKIGGADAAQEITNALKNEAQSNVPGYQRTVEDIRPELAPLQRQTIPSQKKLEFDQANDAALTSNVDRGVESSEALKQKRNAEKAPLYEEAANKIVDVPNKDIYNNTNQFPDIYNQSREDINRGRQYQGKGQDLIPDTFKGTAESDALLAKQSDDLAVAQARLDKANQKLNSGLTPEQRAVVEADINLNKNVVDKLQASIDKRKQVLNNTPVGDLNPDAIKGQLTAAQIEQQQKQATLASQSNKNELTNNKLATSVDVNQARTDLMNDRLQKSKGKNPLVDNYLQAKIADTAADSAAKTGTLSDNKLAATSGINDTNQKVNQLSTADKAAKIQGYQEKSAVLGSNKDRLSGRITSDSDRLALMKAQIAEKESRLSGLSGADKTAAQAEVATNQKVVDDLQNKINETHNLPSLDDVTQMKGNEINQHIKKIDNMLNEKKDGKLVINPESEEFKALSTHLKQLEKWREKVMPTFKQADEIFAKYSNQIDRSAVMEAFKEKLAPLLKGDSVNAYAFADAMRNPEKIIDDVIAKGFNNKNVDGTKRLEKIISPEDRQRLSDILEELNRRNEAEYYVGTQKEIPLSKIPHGNVTTTAYARAAFEALKKGKAQIENIYNSKYLKQAGQDFQNPTNFAAQIDKALPRYQQVQKVTNFLGGTGKTASYGARTGNALIRNISPTDDNAVRNVRRMIPGK
jgi:hypothetical protein